jgi:hypothetical protein
VSYGADTKNFKTDIKDINDRVCKDFVPTITCCGPREYNLETVSEEIAGFLRVVKEPTSITTQVVL